MLNQFCYEEFECMVFSNSKIFFIVEASLGFFKKITLKKKKGILRSQFQV